MLLTVFVDEVVAYSLEGSCEHYVRCGIDIAVDQTPKCQEK